MDALEDSDEAITSYLEADPKADATHSQLYLETYGVLQATFVRCEAVKVIAEVAAGGIEVEPGPAWKEAKRVRNLSVGHPTRATHIPGKKNRPLVGFIVRMSLRRGGFDLFYVDGDDSHTDRIELESLLREHSTETQAHLILILHRLWEELQSEAANRMATPLSVHTQQWTYDYEKIALASNDPTSSRRVQAAVHFGMLKDSATKLLDHLRSRHGNNGDEVLEGVIDEVRVVLYGCARLAALVSAPSEDESLERELVKLGLRAAMDSVRSFVSESDDQDQHPEKWL